MEQASFLGRAEMKIQTLAKVVGAERGREFLLRGDDLIERTQVCVAPLAQRVGEFLGLRHFPANQPESEDERQTSLPFPFFAEVEVVVGASLLLAEADGLIPDQQTSIRFAFAQNWMQSAFREETAQEIDRGARGRIERNAFDFFQRSSMRKEDAVNRSVRGYSNVIRNQIDRVAQIFERGNERGVELARCQLATNFCRVIEDD